MIDWKNLENIIQNNNREINYVESMPVGGVYLPLAKLNKWDVYVYSKDKNIFSIYSYLKYNGADFKGLVYFDSEYEDCMYEQTRIQEIPNPENVLVVIVAGTELEPLGGGIRNKLNVIARWKKNKKRRLILDTLANNGINKWVFMERDELLEVNCTSELCYYSEFGEYYKKNINEVKKTFDLLSDNKSKEILTEYIRTFMESGTFSDVMCDGRDKYFAGYGIDGDKEQLYVHKEDEVWVNCGSSVGDSIILYFANGYSAKKIYAYEGGNGSIFEQLVRNISLLPDNLRDVVQLVNCFISNETSWDDVITEKITLINADIEGAEMSLIQTMKDKMVKDRPVISLCVYHKVGDIIDIPNRLSGILTDYLYVLRKYPSTILNSKRTSELVLYCIPRERYINLE